MWPRISRSQQPRAVAWQKQANGKLLWNNVNEIRRQRNISLYMNGREILCNNRKEYFLGKEKVVAESSINLATTNSIFSD
jgi:hypothetical protein